VNRAVVMDFSRWMQNMLEVNREEMWARVQPGVVQDELNAHVRPLGLLFGPTPRHRTGRPSAACSATTPAARTPSPTA
jgi:FAD/FMN-containing dehydrogenase